MSKTVLERALDHLLNKEENKASALLHDYYVSIGRKVYEDIMADEDMYDEDSIANAIDEVDSDLREEDEEAPEGEAAPEKAPEGEAAPEGEKAAADDLDTELNPDDKVAPMNAEVSDVADAMMDVESALAKLKKEFEEMASGANVAEPDAEAPAAEEPAAEEPKEGIEESLELKKVSAPDNSDKADETRSPVAGKNPNMARPAVKMGGGDEKGGKAPKVTDMGGTTKPDFKKVSVKGVKG